MDSARTGIVIGLILIASLCMAQESGRVTGKVTDERGRPMELVNVAILGLPGGTVTDRKGHFDLTVPANEDIELIVSFVGYGRENIPLRLKPGETVELTRKLEPTSTELPAVEVEDNQIRQTNLIRIDPKIASVITTVSDGIPALLKTLPGVSSSNELSSQYSVRGGNFDENLVYVNDIEIYRPFLIRSGQQEGLSFVNSDLVSSALFSAGGFDAKYGDKMSSALDIQYKKPADFGGSASISLLGGSFHVEGLAAKKKTSYLLGVRHKTNQYLLKNLETKGDYKPVFTDVQSLINIELSKKFEVSLLGNYSDNNYKLVPESRETDFGTFQEAKRLTIYFDGQEVDKYTTWLGGVTLTYMPVRKTRLRIIFSGYNSEESETYDLLGQYWIGQLGTAFGDDSFGQVVETQGVGSYLNHARNKMNAAVYNIGHTGAVESGNRMLQWGVRAQREYIEDRMNEWVMIDSAGYSVPRPPDSVGYTNPGLQPYFPFELYEVINTFAELTSNRYTAYIQNTWGINTDSSGFTFTAGVRGHYWDYNKQLLISPRVSLAYRPMWENDWLFRVATGMYYQPPFYRELKNLQGEINPDIRAQSSFHVVVGGDYNFMAWNRPFKFITEVYYKYLDDLIPYLVDNVRIRYYGRNNAKGYAAGIDMKVNGEFVRGVESWASFSVMKTEEDILDDVFPDNPGSSPGYIPRPADQRVNFSLFFQDYLPRFPSYKMSITLTFGSGLPFGPPKSEKYKHDLRMPPYRRVDIGFSKEIIGEGSRHSHNSPWRVFESLWITAEVLNLLQVNNTVSYIWVTDVYGFQYAVPNYLTPRQLNMKLVARF